MNTILYKEKIHGSVLFLFFMLLIFGISSCKKFLEEPLDNRSELNTLTELEAKTIKDMPGVETLFTDLMTDDYMYKNLPAVVNQNLYLKARPIFDFTILRQSLSKSELLFNDGGYNPTSSFLNYYNKISNAYLTMNQVNKVPIKTPEDQIRKNNILAQALSIKAYCHFMLVNLFAKQYDSLTADKDLGIPYVDKYDDVPVVMRKRASVKFVYDQVEADWLNALDLINEKNSAFQSNFYFSKKAIYGLLSRLYLYKKDWDRSLNYSNLASLLVSKDEILNLTEFRKQFNTPLDQYGMRSLFGDNKLAEFSLSYYSPDNASYLVMGDNSLNMTASPNLGFYADPAKDFAIDLGLASGEFVQTSPLYNDFFPNKVAYFFQYGKINMNLPLVTIDEVYFNRAEAYIAKGLYDSAWFDLSDIVKKQNLTASKYEEYRFFLEKQKNRPAYTNILLRFKRFRFMGEGMRWFDIKRQQMKISHSIGGAVYTLDGKPESYIIQFPLEEIQANPLLQ